MEKKRYDIADRALEFAAQIALFTDKLPKNDACHIYQRQLIRASSSIGANIEEADGSLSRRDFVNKMAIARREARESRYWLLLLQKAGFTGYDDPKQNIMRLINEARELMLILSSIINKFKGSRDFK